jgi:hypothetical protein
MSEAKASHTERGLWFLLSTAFPACGVINQPHYIKMSSQGVMSSKQANNNPGFCPIKGQ